MMPFDDYMMVILGMGAVTYIPRWIPLVALSNRNLPEWLMDWLGLIPAAILGSLLIPTLITMDNPRSLNLIQPESLAAIPAFIVALKTRSLGLTALVGMMAFWLLEKWF